MTDGKGCECFARCEADCVCDADWTPEEVVRLRAESKKYRTALEQIIAPFEDLNFVSGNKLLTYIHDVATAALAAKEEK